MAKGTLKFLTEDQTELQGFFVNFGSSMKLLHIHFLKTFHENLRFISLYYIMVKGEIVKFLTEDKIELQGFLVDSKSDVGILHIPGINGNFYENSFVDYLEGFAEKKKLSFLSMNTRGHDYVNELDRKINGRHETVYIGGALEKFEECVFDIRAGIDFLKSKGCEKVILQGHSSGAQKITYYAYKANDKSVCGLVLLSQADDMNLIRKMLGNDLNKWMKLVEGMVKNGKREEFLPKLPITLPITSAGRLWSLISPDNVEARLFDYTGEMKEFGSIQMPILNIIAGGDIYLTLPADKTLDVVKSKALNSKRFDGVIIKNAPHDFRGYEKELADAISMWLDSVI